MEYMFCICSSLTSLDVSSFDTSKVTNMRDMFHYCSKLTTLDVSGFDTSNVTDMQNMFYNCSSLTSLDVSSFDTSNVTCMQNMFYYCSKLASIRIGEKFKFNGKNITNINYKALFPTPAGNQYTRKWIQDDQSYGPYTAEELRDNYTPEMAGTWVWESDGYSLRFSYPNGQTSTKAGTPASDLLLTDVNATGMNYYSLFGWTNNPSPDQLIIDELTNDELTNGIGNIAYYRKDSNGYDVFLYHDNEGKVGDCGTNYNILTIPAGTYSKKANITLYPLCKPITRTSTLTNGEMTVTLKGGERAVFSGLPAGTVYSIYEETAAGWTLVSHSRASGVIEPLTVSAAEFTNLYSPDEASVQFNARVKIEGEADSSIMEAGRFSFELYEKTSAGSSSSMTLIQTVTNKEGGMIQFDPIAYIADGTHEYIIKEMIGSDDKYVYDENEKTVTVTINTNTDGLLHANINYENTSDIPVFTNTLKPSTLIISKEAQGVTDTNKDNEFEFEVNLTNNNGLPISNDGSYEWYTVENAKQQVINRTGRNVEEYSKDNNGDKYNDNDDARKDVIEDKTGIELIPKGIIGSIIPTVTVYAENLIASGTLNECSWKITNDGTLMVWPTNGVSGVILGKNSYLQWPWYSRRNEITSLIIKDGVSINGGALGMFYEFNNCIEMDLSGLDTSNVTNMGRVFQNCSSLTSLDVSGFDTSNVTSMDYMFDDCNSLTSLDLLGFDTSNVTDMYCMFEDCYNLTSLDVSGFDTSKVTIMTGMFCRCYSLTSLDVSGFDTSNVKNIWKMFYRCSSLTSLDVSKFNLSNVTSTEAMFIGCSNLTSLDVSRFDISKVTNVSSMFAECSSLTSLDVSRFDTSQVKDMSSMFAECSNLISLDVSGFDTSRVTKMSSMFKDCSNLTSLDVSEFDTSKVTAMGGMFSGCRKLALLDLSGFDTSNVLNMVSMFPYTTYYHPNLLSITIGEKFKFNGNNITNTNIMARFPIPYDNQYTGKWIREDYSCGPYTAEELRDNYTSEMAGTWVWEVKSDYAVIQFDANNGTTTAEQVLINNTEYNIEIPDATTTSRPNYTLLEWNTKKDGSGTSYAPGSNSSSLANFGAITTLYANWEYEKEHKCTVYHYIEDVTNVNNNSNGNDTTGNDNDDDNTVLVNGKKYTLADTDVLFTKKTNIIPSTKTYGGYKAPDAQNIRILENDSSSVSYYYDAVKYTLHYDSNGGTGVMSDQEIYPLYPWKLAANEFTNGNALFAGWNTKPDGTGVSYINMQIVRYASWMGTGESSITLYAQWIENYNEPKTYSNGTFKVLMKAGQSVVIKGLPAGSTYTVREVNIPEGWSQVNSSGTSGELVPGSESRVSFTNAYTAKGSAVVTAHTKLIGGTPANGQFGFVSNLKKVTVSTSNVPSSFIIPGSGTPGSSSGSGSGEGGDGNTEWSLYSGNSETAVISLGQQMSGVLDIWWYNDTNNNPYDYISISDNNSSISERLEGTSSHRGELYHNSYPVTASEIFIESHVEYTTASDPDSGYPYYGFYATFMPDNNAGSQSEEIVHNGSVDTNAIIAGNTEDDYTDNPWYNTAPARFETKTFQSPGVYEYVVNEIQGNDVTIGEYDNHEETVIINVTDNGNGTLKTETVYDDDGCLFINSMATVSMKVQTVLENATDAAREKEFTYNLILKDASGNVITSEITATKSTGEVIHISGDNGSFTLKAGEYVILEGLPNGAVYEITEHPLDGFESLARENSSGTINLDNGRVMPDVTFTNMYNTRGSVALKAITILENDNISNWEFEYRLLDKDGNVVDTVYTDPNGEALFRPIYYSKNDAGKEYTYYIEAVAGDKTTIQYDTHTAEVKVKVIDNGTSEMEVVTEYINSNTFVNRRLSTLTISKVIEIGKGNLNQDFQFDITINDNGTAIEGEYQAVKLSGGRETAINAVFNSGKATVMLKAGESVTIKGIPVNAEYLVVETPDDYYSHTELNSSGRIQKDGNKAVFTNQMDKIDILVRKEWDDNNNLYGLRPESASFVLIANDIPIKLFELNEANDWALKVEKLDKYTDSGSEIHYELKEIDVPNYKGEISTEISDDSTMNTLTARNSLDTKTLEKLNTAKVRITKTIEQWHEPFGDAVFLFHIKGTSKYTNSQIEIYKEIVFSPDDIKVGKKNIEIELPMGIYEIEECGKSRYLTGGLTEDKTVAGGTPGTALDGLVEINEDRTKATIDLEQVEANDQAVAGIIFPGEIKQYEKYSHMDTAINHIYAPA